MINLYTAVEANESYYRGGGRGGKWVVALSFLSCSLVNSGIYGMRRKDGKTKGTDRTHWQSQAKKKPTASTALLVETRIHPSK